LEADLRAYGFDTWVDRQHLEGGADWARVIEQQIEQRETLVVALSPDAITSTWVRREITFALNGGKHIIPIIARPVASTPIEIVNLQYIDLSADYTSGLQDLRVALLKTRTLPPPPRPARAPQPLLTLPDVGDPLKGLVEIPAAPPAPNPDRNALFMQAQTALAHGNLDLAEALLGQVVEQEADFGNGLASEELSKVREQLGPIRIERLRALASEAHAKGAWGQEIGALRALLAAEKSAADAAQVNSSPASGPLRRNAWDEPAVPAPSPWDDPAPLPWDAPRPWDVPAATTTGWGASSDATQPWAAAPHTATADLTKRLERAENCQKWAWLYENARAFAQSGDEAATRLALSRLWEKAPEYGDPSSIAPDGMTPPVLPPLPRDKAGQSADQAKLPPRNPQCPTLVVRSGMEPGRVVDISKVPFSIGRHRDCDLFLEDLAVSRLHASIIHDNGGLYSVRDENSANGVLVNGRSISVHGLQDGDQIQIGSTVLVYRAPEPRNIFRIFSN
ncbi:MAG TPA: TIR domain-containing protein, partial [Ktedonobacterales bacterium]|nr:TIR domain-containing protein [Ktedonobacterales bacterium]